MCVIILHICVRRIQYLLLHCIIHTTQASRGEVVTGLGLCGMDLGRVSWLGFSWHGCAVCLREGLASVRRRSTLVYLDALSAPRALYGE